MLIRTINTYYINSLVYEKQFRHKRIKPFSSEKENHIAVFTSGSLLHFHFLIFDT